MTDEGTAVFFVFWFGEENRFLGGWRSFPLFEYLKTVFGGFFLFRGNLFLLMQRLVSDFLHVVNVG